MSTVKEQPRERTSPLKWYLGKYLIRQRGHRAIRVVVRPFSGIRQLVSDEELAERASWIALRKGWKTIFVVPDEYYGEDAYVFNTAQHLRSITDYTLGTYLCEVGHTTCSGFW